MLSSRPFGQKSQWESTSTSGSPSLQFRERAAHAAMIRQLVTRGDTAPGTMSESRANLYVQTRDRALPSTLSAASVAASSGVLPRSRATMYAAYHVRPVVLRSGRLVPAVALFCFAQKLGQRRDVRAESSSGKPRRDLLKQPAVAVRITEGGEREIGTAFRVAAGRASLRSVARRRLPSKWNTSLTSTPCPISWARAASRSSTTRNVP